jgi:tetratricopeptide (TPR) repeat protein
MVSQSIVASLDAPARVAEAVERYRSHGNVAVLHLELARAVEGATTDQLAESAEPFRDIPEVAGYLYEKIVDASPDDARAIVILANAYWLAGRGPDVVGELATRAIAADPTNRGAWHLWALTEANPRQRTTRWKQVSDRFPEDDLARASLADNAASLAGAERDYQALDLAIETYEELWARSPRAEQREALEKALASLRGWKF